MAELPVEMTYTVSQLVIKYIDHCSAQFCIPFEWPATTFHIMYAHLN